MFENIEIGMLGKHQINNACLALDASLIMRDSGLAVSDDSIDFS